jgi:signal transduction histidine kinase/CheY-like chemotaxis protein
MTAAATPSAVATSQRTPPDAPATDEARVRADQAALLQGNVKSLMLGNAAATLIAVLMLGSGAAPWALWPWVALQAANIGFNSWAAWRVGKRPATPRNAQRRLRAAAIASTTSGLLWALGVAVLWQPGDFASQLLLIFLITGLSANALNSLNAHLPAFYGFFMPCTLSALGAMLTDWNLRALFVAIMAATYIVTSAQFVKRLHATLVESLRRRYQVETLAADLRAQKELAEQASQAKSRFLAAASHDLRQPVHALSLFVGALGQRPLDGESRRLVDHVQGAVDSMGTMFNALLDVSQLDAGMVPVHPRVLALRPLLQRIADDEGALAQQKGLRLRLNAPELAVRCDPVLLERVLRNLVSNAVHYTDRGGVLLSARVRGGAVRVRVQDTGIGIPPQRQAEVFQEFVQLHNPERDRAKGLGLGLAIVRRLVDLLDVPLALHSVPGRGTCFTLRLPLAPLAAVEPEAAPQPAASPATAAPGDLVLVVDDDAEIRGAMADLLAGWGLRVIAAAGMAELQPQLMALTAPPRLAICDYRLSGDETGLAVAEELQTLFNDELPIILITGDTAAVRLRDARTSGHVLLHKPVSPQALQMAMAVALAVPAEAG